MIITMAMFLTRQIVESLKIVSYSIISKSNDYFVLMSNFKIKVLNSSEFSSIQFRCSCSLPNTHSGVCIILRIDNGDFRLISLRRTF